MMIINIKKRINSEKSFPLILFSSVNVSCVYAIEIYIFFYRYILDINFYW